MSIITNLTKLVEELTAQKMMPVSVPEITENFSDNLPKATEDDEIDEDWPYTDEDYASNMPCDFSGFCAGTSCPNFFKCKGSIK